METSSSVPVKPKRRFPVTRRSFGRSRPQANDRGSSACLDPSTRSRSPRMAKSGRPLAGTRVTRRVSGTVQIRTASSETRSRSRPSIYDSPRVGSCITRTCMTGCTRSWVATRSGSSPQLEKRHSWIFVFDQDGRIYIVVLRDPRQEDLGADERIVLYDAQYRLARDPLA